MSLFLDLAIIGIFLFCIISGAMKGFIKIAIGIAGTILAIIIAYSFASSVGSVINDKFMHPMMKQTVADSISSALPEGGKNATVDDIQSMLDDSPAFLTAILGTFGVNKDTVEERLEQLESENIAKGLIDRFASSVAATFSHKVSYVLAFVLLFVVALVAVRVAGWLLGVFFELPVFSTANHLLGGCVGLVNGVLLVFVFCVAVTLLSPFLGSAGGLNITDVVEDTFLFKFLYNINPIGF